MTGSGEITADRAGFLNRFSALFIDVVLLRIVLQVVIMILFALTGGAVQSSFGFNTTSCEPVTTVPAGLDPPIPADFNSIVECRTSLLGFDTERRLVASKAAEGGTEMPSAEKEYYLGADGQPVDAWPVNDAAVLILLAYLVVMDWWQGATFGKQFIRVRTVTTDDPNRIGMPIGKAITRQLVLWAPLWLAYLSMAILLFSLGDDQLSAIGEHPAGTAVLIAVAAITIGWFLWISVQVARKQDPIYDRLAGTTTRLFPPPRLPTAT